VPHSGGWHEPVPRLPHEPPLGRWGVLMVAGDPLGQGLGDVLRVGVGQSVRRIGDDTVYRVVGQSAQDGEAVAVQDITHHGDHLSDPQPHASHAPGAPTAHPTNATTPAPPAEHATPGTTPAPPT